ncbi:response regulator [Heliobacterium undosum]|uniref:Stage 0 sporulation protein A homolog n=1 Tax=Heliomicrobium undosum TaxID=121734 RepID=A0A845L7E7_9FIRM|nr:HD domain-containing phosphohydrolase [Heliomicrobium undosum]MZP29648.1 response regulator [Heliomicrobium undosum]
MENSRILVVDDNKANRMLLCGLLKQYTVMEADSGKSALEKLGAAKPDLILLDVMMPDMDGYTVLSVIKNNKETQLIPVVLITALHGTSEKIKSLEIGADDFITKPFNPLELQARVKSLLRIKALQDELESFQNVVFSLAQALEARDDYSVNHSKRTSEFAYQLALRVIDDPGHAELIKTAGLLHDIGKIGIRDEILFKPGKLTPEEFETIKSHPVTGEKICASIQTLAPILPLIRHHHESYNGLGYPDGLRGEEIPLGGRILAIADTYDALTSDRPYRKALPVEEALHILRRHAGEQWDPALIACFCGMIEAKGAS